RGISNFRFVRNTNRQSACRAFMMDKKEFGKRLSQLLAMTGNSMKDLAQKCEIPYSTIRGYVAGDSIPSGIDQLQKIARSTGVSASWLLGEDANDFAAVPEPRSVEKDIELLNSLFRYMTPAQRASVLKRILVYLDNWIKMLVKIGKGSSSDFKNIRLDSSFVLSR
ncbi:helix-turn-helix domain-containing protein, partial [Klebsiella pneumoniae]|uniref:helix-turn-helix domain-containing protein n=1 Tax=Klebsiella pneumoniae TaxID=573 RepID=UPI001C6FE389